MRARRSLISVLLAGILLVQPSIASASEASYWSERRRAADRRSDLVWAGGVGSALSSDLGRAAGARLSGGAGGGERVIPPWASSEVQALFRRLTPARGALKILAAARSSSPPLGTVLLIQDLHRHADAQRVIHDTVSDLLSSGWCRRVGLEGAFRSIDLRPLRDISDATVLRKTASVLRRNHEIAGAVAAGLTTAVPEAVFQGVDDPRLHRENVEAYRRSAARRSRAARELADRRAALARNKSAWDNPALSRWDRDVQDWRRGVLPLTAFARRLTEAAPAPGPHLRRLVDVLSLEERMDFSRVDRERRRAWIALAPRLPDPDREALVSWAAAQRSGAITAGEFHRRWRTLVDRFLPEHPESAASRAYAAYLSAAEAVDAAALIVDLRAAEAAVYARWARTEAERRDVAEDRRLHLQERLLDFALSPEEWGEYRSRPGDGMEDFEAFYRAAEARNRALADNALRLLSPTPELGGNSGSGARDGAPRNFRPGGASKGMAGAERTAVVVAGGWHARAVADRLARSGVVVVGFTPRVERVDTAGGAVDLEFFLQDKTPLERLFTRDKLFLSPDPAPPFVLKTLAPHVAVGLAALREKSTTVPEALFPAGTRPRVVRRSATEAAVEAPGGRLVVRDGAPMDPDAVPEVITESGARFPADSVERVRFKMRGFSLRENVGHLGGALVLWAAAVVAGESGFALMSGLYAGFLWLHAVAGRWAMDNGMASSDGAPGVEDPFWLWLAGAFFAPDVRIEYETGAGMSEALRPEESTSAGRTVRLNLGWVARSRHSGFRFLRPLFFPIVLSHAQLRLWDWPGWAIYPSKLAAVLVSVPWAYLRCVSTRSRFEFVNDVRASARHWDADGARKVLAIYGGARVRPEDPEFQRGVRFGRAAAARGFVVRTGAGPGHMTSTVEGAKEVDGAPRQGVKIDGVGAEGRVARAIPAGNVTHHDKFPIRKASLNHGAVGAFMPGGMGTVDEFYEALFQNRRLVFLGAAYWGDLIETWKHELLRNGMAGASDFENVLVTDEDAVALDFLESASTLNPDRHFTMGRVRAASMAADAERALPRLAVHDPVVVFLGAEPLDPAQDRRRDLHSARAAVRSLADRLSAGGVFLRAAGPWADELLSGLPNVDAVLPGPPADVRSPEAMVAGHGPLYQYLLSLNAAGYVVAPTDIGGMNVFWAVLTQIQTGKIPRVPVVLVGGRRLWDPLLTNFIDAAESHSPPLITPGRDRDLVTVVDTAEEAWRALGYVHVGDVAPPAPATAARILRDESGIDFAWGDRPSRFSRRWDRRVFRGLSAFRDALRLVSTPNEEGLKARRWAARVMDGSLLRHMRGLLARAVADAPELAPFLDAARADLSEERLAAWETSPPSEKEAFDHVVRHRRLVEGLERIVREAAPVRVPMWTFGTAALALWTALDGGATVSALPSPVGGGLSGLAWLGVLGSPGGGVGFSGIAWGRRGWSILPPTAGGTASPKQVLNGVNQMGDRLRRNQKVLLSDFPLLREAVAQVPAFASAPPVQNVEDFDRLVDALNAVYFMPRGWIVLPNEKGRFHHVEVSRWKRRDYLGGPLWLAEVSSRSEGVATGVFLPNVVAFQRERLFPVASKRYRDMVQSQKRFLQTLEAMRLSPGPDILETVESMMTQLRQREPASRRTLEWERFLDIASLEALRWSKRESLGLDEALWRRLEVAFDLEVKTQKAMDIMFYHRRNDARWTVKGRSDLERWWNDSTRIPSLVGLSMVQRSNLFREASARVGAARRLLENALHADPTGREAERVLYVLLEQLWPLDVTRLQPTEELTAWLLRESLERPDLRSLLRWAVGHPQGVGAAAFEMLDRTFRRNIHTWEERLRILADNGVRLPRREREESVVWSDADVPPAPWELMGPISFGTPPVPETGTDLLSPAQLSREREEVLLIQLRQSLAELRDTLARRKDAGASYRDVLDRARSLDPAFPASGGAPRGFQGRRWRELVRDVNRRLLIPRGVLFARPRGEGDRWRWSSIAFPETALFDYLGEPLRLVNAPAVWDPDPAALDGVRFLDEAALRRAARVFWTQAQLAERGVESPVFEGAFLRLQRTLRLREMMDESYDRRWSAGAADSTAFLREGGTLDELLAAKRGAPSWSSDGAAWVDVAAKLSARVAASAREVGERRREGHGAAAEALGLWLLQSLLREAEGAPTDRPSTFLREASRALLADVYRRTEVEGPAELQRRLEGAEDAARLLEDIVRGLAEDNVLAFAVRFERLTGRPPSAEEAELRTITPPAPVDASSVVLRLPPSVFGEAMRRGDGEREDWMDAVASLRAEAFPSESFWRRWEELTRVGERLAGEPEFWTPALEASRVRLAGLQADATERVWTSLCAPCSEGAGAEELANRLRDIDDAMEDPRLDPDVLSRGRARLQDARSRLRARYIVDRAAGRPGYWRAQNILKEKRSLALSSLDRRLLRAYLDFERLGRIPSASGLFDQMERSREEGDAVADERDARAAWERLSRDFGSAALTLVEEPTSDAVVRVAERFLTEGRDERFEDFLRRVTAEVSAWAEPRVADHLRESMGLTSSTYARRRLQALGRPVPLVANGWTFGRLKNGRHGRDFQERLRDGTFRAAVGRLAENPNNAVYLQNDLPLIRRLRVGADERVYVRLFPEERVMLVVAALSAQDSHEGTFLDDDLKRFLQEKSEPRLESMDWAPVHEPSSSDGAFGGAAGFVLLGLGLQALLFWAASDPAFSGLAPLLTAGSAGVQGGLGVSLIVGALRPTSFASWIARPRGIVEDAGGGSASSDDRLTDADLSRMLDDFQSLVDHYYSVLPQDSITPYRSLLRLAGRLKLPFPRDVNMLSLSSESIGVLIYVLTRFALDPIDRCAFLIAAGDGRGPGMRVAVRKVLPGAERWFYLGDELQLRGLEGEGVERSVLLRDRGYFNEGNLTALLDRRVERLPKAFAEHTREVWEDLAEKALDGARKGIHEKVAVTANRAAETASRALVAMGLADGPSRRELKKKAAQEQGVARRLKNLIHALWRGDDDAARTALRTFLHSETSIDQQLEQFETIRRKKGLRRGLLDEWCLSSDYDGLEEGFREASRILTIRNALQTMADKTFTRLRRGRKGLSEFRAEAALLLRPGQDVVAEWRDLGGEGESSSEVLALSAVLGGMVRTLRELRGTDASEPPAAVLRRDRGLILFCAFELMIIEWATTGGDDGTLSAGGTPLSPGNARRMRDAFFRQAGARDFAELKAWAFREGVSRVPDRLASLWESLWEGLFLTDEERFRDLHGRTPTEGEAALHRRETPTRMSPTPAVPARKDVPSVDPRRTQLEAALTGLRALMAAGDWAAAATESFRLWARWSAEKPFSGVRAAKREIRGRGRASARRAAAAIVESLGAESTASLRTAMAEIPGFLNRHGRRLSPAGRRRLSRGLAEAPRRYADRLLSELQEGQKPTLADVISIHGRFLGLTAVELRLLHFYELERKAAVKAERSAPDASMVASRMDWTIETTVAALAGLQDRYGAFLFLPVEVAASADTKLAVASPSEAPVLPSVAAPTTRDHKKALRRDLRRSLEILQALRDNSREDLPLPYRVIRREGATGRVDVHVNGGRPLAALLAGRREVELPGGVSVDMMHWNEATRILVLDCGALTIPESGVLTIPSEDRTLRMEGEAASRLLERASSPRREGSSPAERLLGLAEGRAGAPAADLHFLNEGLTAAQRGAVQAALGTTDVMVLQGSAGSGKSTTMAEMIRQWVRRGKRVLVVAPQHRALDEVVKKILDLPVVRCANVPERVAPACRGVWLGNGSTAMADVVAFGKELKAKRAAQGTETGVVVAATVFGVATDDLFNRTRNAFLGRDGSFDVLVIEEATLTNLTAALVPLEYLTPSGQVVVAGDDRQYHLPRFSGTEWRLLKGFTRRELNMYRTSLLRWLLTARDGTVAQSFLDENKRSHRRLVHLFRHPALYGSRLKEEGWDDGRSAGDILRVVDLANGAPEGHYLEQTRNGSFFAPDATAAAVSLLRAFLERGVPGRDIALLTPYVAQEEDLVRAVGDAFPDFEGTIATVRRAQGLEFPTVIGVLPRSNPEGRLGRAGESGTLGTLMTRPSHTLAVVMDSRMAAARAGDDVDTADNRALMRHLLAAAGSTRAQDADGLASLPFVARRLVSGFVRVLGADRGAWATSTLGTAFAESLLFTLPPMMAAAAFAWAAGPGLVLLALSRALFYAVHPAWRRGSSLRATVVLSTLASAGAWFVAGPGALGVLSAWLVDVGVHALANRRAEARRTPAERLARTLAASLTVPEGRLSDRDLRILLDLFPSIEKLPLDQLLGAETSEAFLRTFRRAREDFLPPGATAGDVESGLARVFRRSYGARSWAGAAAQDGPSETWVAVPESLIDDHAVLARLAARASAGPGPAPTWLVPNDVVASALRRRGVRGSLRVLPDAFRSEPSGDALVLAALPSDLRSRVPAGVRLMVGESLRIDGDGLPADALRRLVVWLITDALRVRVAPLTELQTLDRLARLLAASA